MALSAVPALLLSAGCVPLAKENAPLTRIEDRRPLAGDFRPDTLVAARSEPEFPSFDELKALARDPEPEGALAEKLERFWRTPIVHNQAWESGDFPTRARNPHLGEFLRIGTWNVKKSLHIRDVADALGSERDYLTLLKPGLLRATRRAEPLRQRERLASADILLFQEMDIGVDRSDYLHTPRFLAQILGMNYAYAPQQIELEPVLRVVESSHPDSADAPDPDRYPASARPSRSNARSEPSAASGSIGYSSNRPISTTTTPTASPRISAKH